jgi:hypothetical protein
MSVRSLGLLVVLGLSLLWTPLVATAQQPGKISRIGVLSRMVKKLMRLHACSISEVPQAVHDAEWDLDAPCLG